MLANGPRFGRIIEDQDLYEDGTNYLREHGVQGLVPRNRIEIETCPTNRLRSCQNQSPDGRGNVLRRGSDYAGGVLPINSFSLKPSRAKNTPGTLTGRYDPAEPL